MDSNTPVCTCSLQLGVYPIDTHNNDDDNILEEVGNKNIDFLGPANSYEKIKIKNKVDELKAKLSEYFYDKESQVISIPNCRSLPKYPRIINPENPKNKKHDVMYINQNCEEILHQQIVSAARKLKLECFVMLGFQSEDCLKFLYDQASQTRKKNKFAELNKYEKKIQRILDIDDISKKDLDICIENHKNWKEVQDCLEDESLFSELFLKE